MARNALLRIGNIVMAEIEDVLGRIENPRKMVNQMLMDMEQAFDQAVAEVSRAIANEKIIERRLHKAEQEVEKLQSDAEKAVSDGADEAASDILDAKVTLDTTAADLKKAHDEAQPASAKLKTQLSDLRSKLESARNRKTTIVARKQTVHNSISTPSSLNSAPFDDFEKLVSEVDGKEIASEVYAEMASTTGVEPDIDKLAKDRKVAAQLEQLKRRSNQK